MPSSCCIWHGLDQIVGTKSSHCAWYDDILVTKLRCIFVGSVSTQICWSIRQSLVQFVFSTASLLLNQMTIYRAKRFVILLDRGVLRCVLYVIKHVNIKNCTIHAYFLELLTYLTILQPYFLQYSCRFGVWHCSTLYVHFFCFFFFNACAIDISQSNGLTVTDLLWIFLSSSDNISWNVETQASHHCLGMGLAKYWRRWRKSTRIRNHRQNFSHQSSDKRTWTIHSNVDQDLSLLCYSKCCHSNGLNLFH